MKKWLESKRKKAKQEVEAMIQTLNDQIKIEQGVVSYINEKMTAKWTEVGFGMAATEDDVSALDVMSQELERRDKRITELQIQLDRAKRLNESTKEWTVSPDTVFKGLVSIATILIVIYAEETRPIISKAMGFVIRPRL